MTARWNARRVLAVLGATAGIIVVLFLLGRAVNLSGRELQALAQEKVSAPAPAEEPVREIDVESLPCFGCHNIERFWRGDGFSHESHLEDVGHCHLCHTFEGHLEVKTRSDTCEGCH